MKYVLIGLLKGYRLVISPLYGNVCRYYPSCSAYALRAVSVHGAVKGSGSRDAGCCAATPGPRAGTTRCQERPSSTRSSLSRQAQWTTDIPPLRGGGSTRCELNWNCSCPC